LMRSKEVKLTISIPRLKLGDEDPDPEEESTDCMAIPSNALHLLRNHTRGKKKCIFSYKGGVQIWWRSFFSVFISLQARNCIPKKKNVL